ncbi:PaaX family transcriptional regulator [Actinoplanes sp. NPDC023936]|uniref:PaaX family transcriptional regulator n=1 Tax=Actinoplanes sp. NPDC023936 TaxID=3154910 RepID=UPI0033C84F00
MGPLPRTVIEAFLPFAGHAELDLVYQAGNAAGIEDQPLRLAIRRMIAAGEITQDGRGRRGRLALTDAGRRRLARDRLGLRLALAQDRGEAPWDGTWRLLAVSVPESERAVRDALRRDLADAGAAVVSTGLYVSPHDLSAMVGGGNLVRAVATSLDIRGVTSPPEIAELLWPALPIVEGYQVAERAISGSEDTGVPVVTRQILLADALERAMRDDPLIPLELRPADWAPSRIRRRWLDAWTRLAARLPEEVVYRGWLEPSRSR